MRISWFGSISVALVLAIALVLTGCGGGGGGGGAQGGGGGGGGEQITVASDIAYPPFDPPILVIRRYMVKRKRNAARRGPWYRLA